MLEILVRNKNSFCFVKHRESGKKCCQILFQRKGRRKKQLRKNCGWSRCKSVLALPVDKIHANWWRNCLRKWTEQVALTSQKKRKLAQLKLNDILNKFDLFLKLKKIKPDILSDTLWMGWGEGFRRQKKVFKEAISLNEIKINVSIKCTLISER